MAKNNDVLSYTSVIDPIVLGHRPVARLIICLCINMGKQIIHLDELSMMFRLTKWTIVTACGHGYLSACPYVYTDGLYRDLLGVGN